MDGIALSGGGWRAKNAWGVGFVKARPVGLLRPDNPCNIADFVRYTGAASRRWWPGSGQMARTEPMMRRLLILAAAIVATAQPAVAGVLERVKETGSLRIGYRADAPPYSYQDGQGRPAGYIVELCREVAAALGPKVRAEYVLVHAGQRFESVRDGKVDILCDPSTVTIARRDIVDFSIPTFLDGASVLSRRSAPVQRFEDLAGKRVGVLIGTTTERVLRDSFDAIAVKATIVPVLDHRNGMKMVEDTELDAYVADRSILAAMLRQGGRPGFELSKRYFSYETYALAIPRDDSAFRLMVDRTLAQLYRSGRVKDILARAFDNAPHDEMLDAMFIINSLPER
ncbi:MAG: amino acid ABC transporter substrate-binding protein [Pseudolabrys sp.]